MKDNTTLESLVREWQDAHRAYDEAVVAWVNAPIELEQAICTHMRKADEALMAFVLD